LTRGMYGYVYTLLRQRGAPEEQLEEIRREAARITNWPADLERELIARRLEDLRSRLGEDDPTMKRLLAGGTPASVADSIVSHTALLDSTGFLALMDENYLASKDVSVPVVNAIAPLYFTLDQQLGDFVRRERQLLGRLARAQFHVFGDDLAPDATFTLRLSDGTVSGYAYNGTIAPAFTTFYGVYDHAFSYADSTDSGAWALPEKWRTPPENLDLSTPLNLVSTNDITGGNSGSPLINEDLEFVGVVFDGNIESLPNEFLYSDRTARTISVDARAIRAVLEAVYGADRLVEELTTGRLVSAETQATSAGD
ncbi:MAG: S46 family peptidase, partial [Rhodothermales bacterium]|nr:S46 family peptidase [Rhodothermales bacterium]